MAGAMVVASCGRVGDSADSADSAVGRLIILEPTADGHGWGGMAGRLASVLVLAGLARSAMVVERPGALGSVPRDAFGAVRGSFVREGRLLVTAMPMVTAAEIANTAAVVDATTPSPAWSGTGRSWSSPPTPACTPSRTSPRSCAATRRR